MRPTPRTDTITSRGSGTIPLISELEDHARTLERELEEAVEALARMVKESDEFATKNFGVSRCRETSVEAARAFLNKVK